MRGRVHDLIMLLIVVGYDKGLVTKLLHANYRWGSGASSLPGQSPGIRGLSRPAMKSFREPAR